MKSTQDEAFVRLYHETYDKVLKYVVSKCSSPDDVPDIMQKTYLNYYERAKKSADIESPADYLFRIAQNEIKKYYRSKEKRKSELPVFSKVEDEDFEAMEATLSQELPEYAGMDTKEVWQYIKSRDPVTFKIFVLYFYYEETLAAIAKTLDIGESNVKHRLYRTIRQIRDKFRLT